MIKMSWHGGPASIIGNRRQIENEQGDIEEVIDLILQFSSPNMEVALEATIDHASLPQFVNAVNSAAQGIGEDQAPPAPKIQVARLVPPLPPHLQ